MSVGIMVVLEEPETSMFEAFSDLKDKSRVPSTMKIMTLLAWSIWIIKNNIIFNNQVPNFTSWKAICTGAQNGQL
jgi:hypothetical protein